MKYALMTREDIQSKALEKQLIAKLNHAGHNLDTQHPDLLIFIGGDGTFLRSVQTYLSKTDKLRFVGVHTGTLGFFCEYPQTHLDQLVRDIPRIFDDAATYRLLEIELVGKQRQIFYAVNEVRVENPFHTFVTNVLIDQQSFQTFRGTGLIVASSLGSSAYNKSLGGALVDVRFPSLQLTEMATIQNNAYRSLGSSLVLDAHRTITFQGDFTNAIFGYDYLLVDHAKDVKEVHVRLSEKTFKLYHQKQHQYFETLRKTFVNNG